MRTKILLSAVALTATFAACNNENVPSSVENNLLENQEIVGATLVSEGGTISLGGIQSRVNANGWEPSDKLALAWYNLEDKITTEQSKQNWDGTGSDEAIYANHLFTRSDEGKFVTNSNIYQGAHFIYFPYTYSGKPGVMSVNVNAKAQTTDYNSDIMNNALYVSAQDFISASEVDAKTGKLAKDFYITPAVNALKVNVTPQAGIASNSFLKNLEISKLDIWNQDALFKVTANINPNLVPQVVYEDGEVVIEETYEALKENLAGAFTSTGVTNLTTNIDADITLANAASLRAFTLPTAVATEDPSWSEIAVHVKANGAEEGVSYNMGYFRLYVKDATHKDEKNQLALKKLQEALYDNTKAYYLGNNINSESKINSVGLNIDLLASEFVADYQISNLEEWNLTVALVDALNSLSTTKIKPTFNVTGAVCVTEGKTINVPAHGLTEVLTTETGAKICFETDYTVNAALANLFSKEDKVEVLTGSTLTIEDEVKFIADVHNDGIINVGYKAQLGYKDPTQANVATSANVDNEHGRINVVYGSYVYAETAKNGTIAYAVDANEYAYKLNNLMSSTTTGENVLGNAYVNTLVVNNGITLNLAKADGNTPASDPYINNAVSGSSVNPAYLVNTTFEVIGGNLISAAAKSTVKAIKVMPSTTVATIKDINVGEELYVMRGASVAFDATANALGKKATASVGTLKNEGTMNVSVSILTKNVYNEKNSSILSVLNKEVVWYEAMYYQGGMAQGDILKMVGTYNALTQDKNLTASEDFTNTTTDGNGYKLTLNAQPNFNGLVTGSGALTITNLTIDGANKLTTILDANGKYKSTRALYLSNVTSALINNVNVSNAGYAMNILGQASSASKNTLIISNSVLKGWASVNEYFALVTIKNTEFGFNTYFENGTENMFNGGFRAYSKTVIEDCTFAEGYYLAIEELNSVATLTLKNCKVGDTVITKSNYKTLLNIEGEASQLVYLTIE